MVHQAIGSYELEEEEEEVTVGSPLCFTAGTTGATVSLWLYNCELEDFVYDNVPTSNFEYSYNKETWLDYTTYGTIITLTATGDKVYFRNKSTTQTTLVTTIDDNEVCHMFYTTGSLVVSGDITTLLKQSGNVSDLTNSGTSCFEHLFQSTSITNAASLLLPSTVLTDSCYYYMFYGCRSLTTPPVLPATTMVNACYAAMFMYCTSLTSVPRLPATVLSTYCYYFLFRYCSQLLWSANYDENVTPYTSYIFPSTSARDWNNGMLINTSGGILVPSSGTQYYCNVPFNS